MSDFSRQKKIIMMAYWSATFVEGASRIMIPLYFASLGVSAINIGLMAFVFEFFGVATNLSAGVLINRIGYKRAFLASLVLHSIASFGYLLLRTDFEIGALMLTVSGLRACRGIGKELMETTSSSYIKQYNLREKGKLAAQVLFGGKESIKGLGLLMGGVLLATFGFIHSFMLLGIVTSIGLICAIFLLKDFRERKKNRFSQILKVSRRMKYLAVTRMLLYSGRDIWLVIALPIYLTQAHVPMLDASFMVASGFVLFGLTQILVGALIKSKPGIGKFRLKATRRFRDSIFITHLFTAIIPLAIFLVPLTIPNIWGIMLLYNFAAGAATVPHNHLHLKYAKKSRSALDISFYKTVGQCGKMTAVLASGWLYDIGGLEGCLMASSVSLLIAAFLGLRLNFLERQKKSLKRLKNMNKRQSSRAEGAS